MSECGGSIDCAWGPCSERCGDAEAAPAEEDTGAASQEEQTALDSEPQCTTPTHRSIRVDDPTAFVAPADAHPLSRKFYAVLAECAKVHDKKQRDYGTDADPFANVRASEDFGIPGWLGCSVRMNDKMRRIMAFARRGELANESLEDAFSDLLVYAGIALVLYRESSER